MDATPVIQAVAEMPFFNWGMVENLASEALGIAVTVLIVDSLLKRRQGNRLTPTHRFFHLQLLKSVHNFLVHTTDLYDKTPRLVVKFGDHNGFRTNDFSEVTDWQIRKSWRSLLPKVEDEMQGRHRSEWQPYTVRWTLLVKNLRELEDRFLPYIEPELLNLLAVAEHELLTSADLQYYSGYGGNKSEPDEERMFKTLRVIFDLHTYLVAESDHHWPV